jgi:hypothetical protein
LSQAKAGEGLRACWYKDLWVTPYHVCGVHDVGRSEGRAGVT